MFQNKLSEPADHFYIPFVKKTTETDGIKL